ncbi:hypothetical protein SB748_11850 [Rhizobium sp. SIMBA_035]
MPLSARAAPIPAASNAEEKTSVSAEVSRRRRAVDPAFDRHVMFVIIVKSSPCFFNCLKRKYCACRRAKRAAGQLSSKPESTCQYGCNSVRTLQKVAFLAQFMR